MDTKSKDQLVRKRSVLRGLITKLTTTLGTRDEKTLFQLLEKYETELSSLDDQIFDVLLENDTSEEDLILEREKAAVYYEKIWAALNSRDGKEEDEVVVDNRAASGLVLPKIELKQFELSPSTWLQFWSQFEQIHVNPAITSENKFMYLKMCLVSNSAAKSIVDSYPNTKDNNKTVMDHLKDRFGKDELIIEVYIRELLSLVLNKNKHNLSKLYDQLNARLRGLELLGLTSDKVTAILYPLVESCLPDDLICLWERSRHELIKPPDTKLTAILSFLKREVAGEERVQLVNKFQNVNISEDWKDERTASAMFTSSNNKGRFNSMRTACVFCKGSHKSVDCFKTVKMSLMDKRECLTKENACLRCFEFGHRARFCRSQQVYCSNCKRNSHHTLMCDPTYVNKFRDATTDPNNESASANLGVTCNTQENTILQTLKAKVKGLNGSTMVRILFDSGCQRSYCTKSLVEKIKLNKIGTKTLSHQLFGGKIGSQEEFDVHEAHFENLTGDYRTTVVLIAKDTLCVNVPRLQKTEYEVIRKESGIELTDVGDGCPDVDVIVGAGDMANLVKGNIRNVNNVALIETALGWLAMGKIHCKETSVASLCLNTCSNFWSLETLGIEDYNTVENRKRKHDILLKEFDEQVKKDSEGRYIVALPFKDNYVLPGNNRMQAMVRADKLYGKMSGKEKEEYHNVFQRWKAENIIEEVNEIEEPNRVHYLPHRPIFKENSTTKCRPVFDAGAKGPSGSSLNQALDTGPNMITKIPSILNRFRQGKIGLSSDIRSAFLAIAVDESDCDLLRFLWFDKEGNSVIFKHRRVVFGLTSSPFHLMACIYHTLNCELIFLETAEKLKDSFYCDNCVTSVDSMEEYSKLKNEAVEIMARSQFDLRGWVNNIEVNDNEGTQEPVLGLIWNRKNDTLSIKILDVNCETSYTKRQLWSVAQKVWDPIGVTLPVQLQVRLLLKEACAHNLKWDDELPNSLKERLKKWVRKLPALQFLEVPRYFGGELDDGASLHTFTDASVLAFSACTFLRSLGKDGLIKVQLVNAKVRISPERATSIPRAELMAILLGVRLVKSVVESLSCKIRQYFWTDSVVALHWLKGKGPWSVFVQNRKKEILDNMAVENFRHCPGVLNLADLPSRGCDAEELLATRWWEGSSWLAGPPEGWPTEKVHFENSAEADLEKKSGPIACSVVTVNNNIQFQTNSYRKIVRVVAVIMRWLRKVREKNKPLEEKLTQEELMTANAKLIQLVQSESKLTLRKNTIDLFEDDKGIIRVRTKLGKEFEEEFRHPILLDGAHHVVKCLIWEKHISNCHASIRNLLSLLRKEYFIIKGRQKCKAIIKRCVKCKRYCVKSAEVPFAPLPNDRTHMGACFEVTGVDHFGPLYTSDFGKVWVVIYTCAVYRALHLEAVENLSTHAFLQSFRRFIARRGKPSKVYSDSGTAFIGADNVIKETIVQFGLDKNIEFIRGPPLSPWYTGWVERLVGISKNLMKRTLGPAKLTMTELTTVLCDLENVANNRPLTYAIDGSDVTALTPNDFLIPGCATEAPEIDLSDKLRGRNKYIFDIRESLKKRFMDEYMSNLLNLGHRKIKELKPGDVVLVGDDNKKRMDWPLAVILETFKGRDGIARCARLKLENGELTRAYQRLYPLEIWSETFGESAQAVDDEKDNSQYVPNNWDSVDQTINTPVGKNKVLTSEFNDSAIVHGSKVPTGTNKTRGGRSIKPPNRLDL